jgi:hypothetical protein
MRGSKVAFGVVAVLFVAGSLACSSASPRNNSETGGSGGEEDTGGSKGSTGGKSGTGGKAGTGGAMATGGSSGSTGGSSGGDTGGAGGSTGGSSGGDTGGAGGSTGGAGGSTGGAGGSGAGGTAGGVAECSTDPKAIHICHQLENACENCGPMKGTAPPKNMQAAKCFDLVEKAYAGMATDADCVKFAADNDCTVDNASTTGNTCGSLTCDPATCGGTHGTSANSNTCAKAKQWGDSTICAYWYAKCPCK